MNDLATQSGRDRSETRIGERQTSGADSDIALVDTILRSTPDGSTRGNKLHPRPDDCDWIRSENMQRLPLPGPSSLGHNPIAKHQQTSDFALRVRPLPPVRLGVALSDRDRIS